MKRKNICLASIVMVSAVVLTYYGVRGFGCSSHEGLRDALERQLADSLANNDFSGTVVGAYDAEQALKDFESHILPTLEDRSETRISSIRRSVEEGKSWVYVATSAEWQTYYLLDLFPSSTGDGYGFCYLVSRRNVLTGEFDPPCENYGLLELLPREDRLCDKQPISAYDEYLQRIPRFEDALPRIGEPCGYTDNLVDVSAIVDVVDVQLVCVTGFDYGRMHKAWSPGCCALYQIRLDVREVEKGTLDSDVYVLETRRSWDEFKHPLEWLYFRGMTLRVSLHRDGSELLLIEEHPVEPYPPYSNDNVLIRGSALVGGAGADEREGNLEPLVVEYGSHTKVEFRNGDIITSGRRATFADFGVTSKFKILELKDGAQKAYWNSVWFAPRKGVCASE